MKKAIVVFTIVLLAGAAGAFANGAQENQQLTGTPEEPATLTGTLKFQPNDFPVLVTDKGNFELMYPSYATSGLDLQLKEGDRISVTGFEVPGPRWEQFNGSTQEDDSRYLRVTSAKIGGKEYIIAGGRGGYGMMGGYGPNGMPGPGMHNGRGGYGPNGSAQRRGGYGMRGGW